MRRFEYKNFSIENAELLTKTGCINKIVCDADKRIISISEEEYQEAEKLIKQKITQIIQPIANAFVVTQIIQPIANAFVETMETMKEAIQPVINAVMKLAKELPNKKITKKRFIKLLQSVGIQRNEINKIIKNNKEPYTYLRYYNIASKLSKSK